MHHFKFQVPINTKKVRGHITAYLYRKFDCITIESKDQIEDDRFLVFGHPFDNWVFEAINENKKLNFFHIDNGYLGNIRYKTPFYYRISYNSLQNTRVCKPPSSRIDKLELDEKVWDEWSPNGDYNLLVMPNPSNIFKYLGEDYDTWRSSTIAHYENLDVPLVVREKEGKRRERFESIVPLIKNCKKVITYHSMAAVEALCLGKPIEILGQSAVQHWQGKINFDRNEMLEHVAWSQFSRNEFGAGIAWEKTFEYQVEQK